MVLCMDANSGTVWGVEGCGLKRGEAGALKPLSERSWPTGHSGGGSCGTQETQSGGFGSWLGGGGEGSRMPSRFPAQRADSPGQGRRKRI